jgi:hypothetical protein
MVLVGVEGDILRIHDRQGTPVAALPDYEHFSGDGRSVQAAAARFTSTARQKRSLVREATTRLIEIALATKTSS